CQGGTGTHRCPPHRPRGGSGRVVRYGPSPRQPGQRPVPHQEITMIRHPLMRRRVAGSALIAALALALTACFGSSPGGATDNTNANVTITFWHGWSAPSEVKAIQATIDGFEKKFPNIHVKAVGNITDDKINQALRAGGSNAPDVVSSFTTDNVGEFCS